MKTLIIASIYDHSGKTMMAVGIGKRLQADGFRVAYMKPLGNHPVTVNGTVVDSDAAFMYEALELDDPLGLVSPIIMTQDLIARAYRGKDLKLQDKIVQAYDELSRDKDVLIIGWAGTINQGYLLDVSIKDLVDRLDACVIVLYKCQGAVFVDDLLPITDMLGDKIVGVVLNQLEFSEIKQVKENVVPFLEEKGLSILGIFLSDPIIMAVTIGELAATLNGEVLCCKHRLNDLVERFSVGTMNVESALKYFRKVKGKAVITSGDRSDIQLAALETDTKCVILTENLRPNNEIVTRAKERDIPIMVVEADTLTVIEQVESIMSMLRIRDERMIRRAAELVNEELNFPLLYKYLGLDQAAK